jgi:hypothetical protein
MSQELRELRERYARATQGKWQLQDSCSWRRIGTRGHDGNVLCPITQRDGHPDLCAGKGEDTYANLELIVAMHAALPSLLARIEALEAGLREIEHAESKEIARRLARALLTPAQGEG